jgi:hypothetical protein
MRVIYFVQSVTGEIKIGISGDPAARFIVLQAGSPVLLSMLGVMLGDREKEREIHTRFEESRLRGEWFRPDPELLAYIEEHTMSIEELPEEPPIPESETRPSLLDPPGPIVALYSAFRPGFYEDRLGYACIAGYLLLSGEIRRYGDRFQEEREDLYTIGSDNGRIPMLTEPELFIAIENLQAGRLSFVVAERSPYAIARREGNR